MNRWKTESTTTLLLMHAHNRMSRWNECLIGAAHELGMVVGFRTYLNCSGDGSTDREWYVSAYQLERAGGMAAVRERAEEMHAAVMAANAPD